MDLGSITTDTALEAGTFFLMEMLSAMCHTCSKIGSEEFLVAYKGVEAEEDTRQYD